MLAVDTNLVVRFLVKDDTRQHARAEALFAAEEVWIAKTVLLETEWVLQSVYSWSGERLVEALPRLAGLPNVRIEDSPAMAHSLLLATHGMEFADALHVSSCPSGTRFITFDRDLVKAARRASLSTVELG